MIKGTVIFIVLPAIFRCCVTFMFIYWRYKFSFSFFFSRTELLGAERDANIFMIEQSEAGTVGYVISACISETSERGLFLVNNGVL